MKIRFQLICLLLLAAASLAPAQSWKQEVKAFRADLDQHYLDPEDSPLLEEDRLAFKGHDYFPARKKYRVEARILRSPEAKPFIMATVSGVKKTFRKFADLHFEIGGQAATLAVYQYQDPETGAYDDELFLPFKDGTTGNLSYGGGRYIDLPGPPEDATTMTLDFNQCYNPYCAYSSGWNCPIPPEENNLSISIPAGVKAWKGIH